MSKIPTDNMPQIMQPAAMLQAVYNYAFRLFRIGRAAGTVLVVMPNSVLLAAAGTTPVQDANTKATFAVDAFDELAVDVSVTAITGTGAGYQIIIDRLGADGVWYPVYTGVNITAAGVQSVSLGTGASTNVAFGKTIRVREVVAGTFTAGQGVTRSISIIGK